MRNGLKTTTRRHVLPPWTAVARRAALACLLMAPGPAAAQLLFMDGFENGRLDKFMTQFARPGSGRIVTVPEPVRAGRRAMRFELRFGDDKVKNGARAELALMRPAVMGEERWYGFSVFLPPDWVSDPEQEVVTQWHGVPDSQAEASLSPPLALRVRGDEWLITNLSDAAPITTVRPDQKVLYRGPISKGHWTDFVFNVRWSADEDGFLKVWKNGVPIVDHAGPVTYNDRIGPRLKIGVYKSGWNRGERGRSIIDHRVIFFDEIRVAGPAGSYDLIAPAQGDSAARASAGQNGRGQPPRDQSP